MSCGVYACIREQYESSGVSLCSPRYGIHRAKLFLVFRSTRIKTHAPLQELGGTSYPARACWARSCLEELQHPCWLKMAAMSKVTVVKSESFARLSASTTLQHPTMAEHKSHFPSLSHAIQSVSVPSRKVS
ncbi:hypothetical protein MPTK1_6g03810 [Marchantia polymorpha subsp. ruderalis]|uniref:Uncharacterized protein n=2 Tax=Marchantia polymorpha TaxID=3197 RepID=A0AAF6BN92_MARPO|nr:hypothetical protein MARPO_0034s0137 [Marchantia polymorpha]BBN13476.1 hypothetical protein Mp_6g03810 [Marchantia polymorpha subsp. ruderalis]|eukprot:PTQ41564.1 hypothetical protein MARPO_0034s0137 [Marchantia polymorpha]